MLAGCMPVDLPYHEKIPISYLTISSFIVICKLATMQKKPSQEPLAFREVNEN